MQGGSQVDLATLVINLFLEGNIDDVANRVAKRMQELDKETAKSHESLKGWEKVLGKGGESAIRLGNNMNQLGNKLTMGVTAPIVALGTAALKSSIDFEDAFAGVKKTVDATEQEYRDMSAAIIEMSNRMPFAATEIASVAEAAGQLGIAKENVVDFSEVMLKIGQATDLGASDAATSLARFANITNMSASSYENLGSTIVALGNNFAATESEIVAMGMRLAAAGNQIGLSEAETMGFAAALRSVGIEAEAGGTAFSKVMLDMDIAASKGGKAIQGYADVAGMSAKDFAKAWEKDAAGALVKFIEGLGRVQDQGGNLAMTLEKLGYTEVRTRDALMRSAGASDMVAQSIRTANSAWSENVALQEEVDKRNETTASKLEVLKNKATNTVMQFGNSLLPIANQAIDGIGGVADRFSNMDEGMRSSLIFTAGGAALAGPFLKVLGNVIKTIGSMPKTIKSVGADLKTFLGLLSNPVTLGIAGAAAVIGGIVYALGTAKREAEEFKRSIAEFDLNLDQGNIDRLTGKIQSGKDAFTAYADVKLQMTTQTDELWAQLEKALSDGKFTKKEFRAVTKAVNEMVDDDIEAAKKAMQEKVDNFVGWMTTITIGEKVDLTALVTSITGAFGQLATDLQGLDFLTPEQVDKIIELAVDPGVTDFNAALAEIGIVDATAQQAVVDAVKPNVEALNTKLSDLGILDENTRSLVIQKVGEQISLLGQGFSGLSLDPGAAQSIANILTTFATEADAKLKQTGIPILQDATQRETLIKAAMKGPEALAAALANRKVFTAAEAEALKAILDPTELNNALLAVDPGESIDRETLVNTWTSALQGVVDDIGGTSLVSEETATSTVTAMQTKADALIADLDAYREEYNRIAENIYKEGATPTEAELARMQELLGKIAEVKTQLSLLGNQAHNYASASSNLVKAGRGDSDMFATALGFEKEQFDRAIVDTKAKYQELVSSAEEGRQAAEQAYLEAVQKFGEGSAEALAALANEDAALANVEKLMLDEAAELAGLKEPYVQSINDLFNGIAQQYPESAAMLEEAVQNYDLLAKIHSAMAEDGLSDSELTSIFTPEVLEKFFEMPPGTDIAQLIEQGWPAGIRAEELAGVLEKKLGENVEGLAENPLVEMLVAAIESGNLDDLQNVDMSSVDGALEGLLKTLDFKESAKGLGTSMMEGAMEGVTEKKGEVDAEITTAAGGFLDAAKLALDINSPSGKFKEVGGYMMEGVKEGITENSESVNTAIGAVSGKMVAAGRDISTKFATGITSGRAAVSSAMQGLGSVINNAANAFPNNMQSVGQRIVDGIIAGINSKASALVAAMQSLANQATNAVQGALDMHSPSRVMEGLGRMTGQGFIDGVDASAEGVETASRRMALSAVSGAEDTADATDQGLVINQTNNIYSPKTLSKSETAREIRRVLEAAVRR